MDAPGITQQAETKPHTLEDAISKAYDQLESQGEEAAVMAEAAAEVTAEQPVEAAVTEPGEELDTQLKEEIAQVADEPEEEAPSAPERWPHEVREAYEKMDRGSKILFMNKVFKPMQAAHTQKTQELADMRRKLDPMMQALGNHAELFERLGVSPDQALRQQLAWTAHIHRVGPEQGTRDMMKAYGVQDHGQEAPSGESQYLTPIERSMQAELKDLRNFVQQQTQASAQQQAQMQQQEAYQARQRAVQSEIDAFKSETVDGKPAHPHLETVGNAMAGLIRGGLVPKQDAFGNPIPLRQQLNLAYQKACKTELDISVKQASTRPSQEQVARASAANREVVSKHSPAPVTGTKTVAEVVDNLYDRMAGSTR